MRGRIDVIRWAAPVGITLALLGSRLAAVPALTDPVTASSPASLYLSTPVTYLVLAPWFSTWDGISMLSMSRLQGFLAGLAALYLIWRFLSHLLVRRSLRHWRVWAREIGLLLLSLGITTGFLLLGAVWHRPMLGLAGVSSNDRVVDFHSHTSLSHDVASTWMRGFDAEANQRWHARAGFDAVFITDHNAVGRGPAVANRQSGSPETATSWCPGIEVSAWRAHVVLLGDTLPVDRQLFSSSLDGLLNLLETSESAYGSLTLASLPEYRRNHWDRLDTLIAAGLDGFEIVNASPKANELSALDRNRVTALARRHNRFVVGVSDSHGWGATSMVWNLVRIPEETPRSALCQAIIGRLQQGFPAVRIVERHRLRPDDRWPMWLTPLGVLWETWRSMGWTLTLSWVVWVWLAWGLAILLRTRTGRAKIARSSGTASSATDQ